MSLLLYFLFVVLSVAFCIVVFLLISAGDLATLKQIHDLNHRNTTALPIISRFGDVISSAEDLDNCVTSLRMRLNDKHQELENSRLKMKNRVDSLQKLESYRMGCLEMCADMVKMEEECKELERKIDYFKRLQDCLQTEQCRDVRQAMAAVPGDYMSYNSRVAL